MQGFLKHDLKPNLQTNIAAKIFYAMLFLSRKRLNGQSDWLKQAKQKIILLSIGLAQWHCYIFFCGDVRSQCDRIGYFFKFLGNKFNYKSSTNEWSLLGQLWKPLLFKSNQWGYFLGNSWKKLGILLIPTSGHTVWSFWTRDLVGNLFFTLILRINKFWQNLMVNTHVLSNQLIT